MTKTIQLGIRIEKDLLDRIEELAKDEGIDRNLWIKRALATFVSDQEDAMTDSAIEDFIHLRIDEKELLKYTIFNKIPNDLKSAREDILKFMTEKRKKEISKK